jgi:phospholipid transport system transporter-binding protein
VLLGLPVDLSLRDATAVSQRLCSELRGLGEAEVVIDAGALRHFDSSALAVLLECRREAARLGKPFRLHDAPAKLLALADLYGVRELFSAAPAAD